MDIRRSNLTNLFLKFDRFGIPLNLNFESQGTYRTRLGLLLTILQYISVLVYLSYQLITIYEQSDLKIYSQEEFYGEDSSLTQRILKISSEEVGFNVRIQYYGTNTSWQGDEAYTLFTPYIFNDLGNGTKLNQEISVIHPTNNTFTTQPYPPSSYVVWKDKGALFSSVSALKGALRLEIYTCNQNILNTIFPGKTCKTKEEAFNAISNVQIYIEVTYRYFDSTNFTDPVKVKKSLEGFGLSNSFSHAKTIALRERILRLKDNIISPDFGIKHERYYSIANVIANYYVNDANYKNRMLSYNVVLDDTIETTVREVRNLGQALSSVGGALGLFTAANLVIINFFGRIRMEQDLIASTFKYQNISKQEFYFKNDLFKSLISRTGEISKIFTYKDLLLLKITSCCPLMRTQRLKKFGKIRLKANMALAKEMSIQNVIKVSRQSKLLSKLLLPNSLRSIFKELLIKDLSLMWKSTHKPRPVIYETTIDNILNKQKKVYKRFQKYIFRSFNLQENRTLSTTKRIGPAFPSNNLDQKNEIEEFFLDDETKKKSDLVLLKMSTKRNRGQMTTNDVGFKKMKKPIKPKKKIMKKDNKLYEQQLQQLSLQSSKRKFNQEYN